MQKVFASSERGSMLPLFLGLVGIALVLALGATEICANYLVRQSLQEDTDQLTLLAVGSKFRNAEELASSISMLNSKIRLRDFRVTDGQTVELSACLDWQGWLRLPGLKNQQTICVESAAR